jgi:small subunit ribosomal protein S6
MRNYEAMFIFKPSLEEEKLEKEIKSVERAIKTRGKGEVKHSNLGKKVLAYPIKKFSEGVYINYTFTAQTAAIAKIKEALKHKESILRFVVLSGGK